MDDRTMLELAAKAVGIVNEGFDEHSGYDVWWLPDANSYDAWNPLENDGDALRLAVKLGLDVELHGCLTVFPYACAYDCERNIAEEEQPDDGDVFKATRRAITRAAAAIQLAKESGK